MADPPAASQQQFFVGRISCAICQGDAHTDYCSLGCGHPFHVIWQVPRGLAAAPAPSVRAPPASSRNNRCAACCSIETWIERGKASCPICRDKVSRRSIRPLIGCETVPDEPGGGGGGDEALLQRLAEQRTQVQSLQQQLASSEEQVDNLQQSVLTLAGRQERLQHKLAAARRRCEELDAARSRDSLLLSDMAADKERLQDKYRSDVVSQPAAAGHTVRHLAAAGAAAVVACTCTQHADRAHAARRWPRHPAPCSNGCSCSCATSRAGSARRRRRSSGCS